MILIHGNFNFSIILKSKVRGATYTWPRLIIRNLQYSVLWLLVHSPNCFGPEKLLLCKVELATLQIPASLNFVKGLWGLITGQMLSCEGSRLRANIAFASITIRKFLYVKIYPTLLGLSFTVRFDVPESSWAWWRVCVRCRRWPEAAADRPGIAWRRCRPGVAARTSDTPSADTAESPGPCTCAYTPRTAGNLREASRTVQTWRMLSSPNSHSGYTNLFLAFCCLDIHEAMRARLPVLSGDLALDLRNFLHCTVVLKCVRSIGVHVKI